jgi:hypothetical protein
VINDADPPIWYPGRRKIFATFRATIVQGKPDDFQFAHDDGVRLNVVSVTDLHVTGTGPPPWAKPAKVP